MLARWDLRDPEAAHAPADGSPGVVRGDDTETTHHNNQGGTMSDPTYQPEYAVPTQVAYPWRAAVRTGIAGLVAVAVVAPIVWGIIAEELTAAGVVIPDSVARGVLAGLALLAAASGIVTRIMAIPQVSEALTVIGLGPTPKP